MSRILLIKTSSLGDVVHTLPALTDAWRYGDGALQVDWVVEEAFVEIPRRHPAVQQVIPVAMRRWRRRPLSRRHWREVAEFRRRIGEHHYDVVIDAQGLLKSALIATWVRGDRSFGFDRASAREPLAAWFYRQRVRVPQDRHAIDRSRQLFAAALGYACPVGAPDYGIAAALRVRADAAATVGAGAEAGSGAARRFMFVHGTSWQSKLWPEQYWRDLAVLIAAAGHEVVLPWGSAAEHERAQRIAEGLPQVVVLPRLGLPALMGELMVLDGAVCVDTGLGHLLAALGVPAVSLYGPTGPDRIGTRGARQLHLCEPMPCSPCLKRDCVLQGRQAGSAPPCLERIRPADAWRSLEQMVATRALPV